MYFLTVRQNSSVSKPKKHGVSSYMIDYVSKGEFGSCFNLKNKGLKPMLFPQSKESLERDFKTPSSGLERDFFSPELKNVFDMY